MLERILILIFVYGRQTFDVGEDDRLGTSGWCRERVCDWVLFVKQLKYSIHDT